MAETERLIEMYGLVTYYEHNRTFILDVWLNGNRPCPPRYSREGRRVNMQYPEDQPYEEAVARMAHDIDTNEVEGLDMTRPGPLGQTSIGELTREMLDEANASILAGPHVDQGAELDFERYMAMSRADRVAAIVPGIASRSVSDAMNAQDTTSWAPPPASEDVESVVDQTLRSLDDFLAECDEICGVAQEPRGDQ